jgi:hypothetical protein
LFSVDADTEEASHAFGDRREHCEKEKEETWAKKKKSTCEGLARMAYTLREFQAEDSLPCRPSTQDAPNNYAARVIRERRENESPESGVLAIGRSPVNGLAISTLASFETRVNVCKATGASTLRFMSENVNKRNCAVKSFFHTAFKIAAVHLPLRVNRRPDSITLPSRLSSLQRPETSFGVQPSTIEISSQVKPSSLFLITANTRSCAWVSLPRMLLNAARDSVLPL